MINKNNFAAILICMSILSTTSCKKDDNESVGSQTKSEMLMGNNWVLEAWTIDPPYDWNNDGIDDTDVLQFMDDCKLDDLMNFKSDASYLFEEGNTKCDPTDDQIIETGTWTLSTNENVLLLTETGDDDPKEFPIKSLSAKQLILEIQTYDRWTDTTYSETRVYK
ncbi:lipocalin family protein [Owenweeksia hongkongensis]|uniref:lipocalin family protein n=1 Tax=Owenweeksia hongkongensis TaxID=253245 RepID=UPI003A93105A